MYVCMYVCMYVGTYVCMYVTLLLLYALHLGRQTSKGSSATLRWGRHSFVSLSFVYLLNTTVRTTTRTTIDTNVMRLFFGCPKLRNRIEIQ